MMVETLKLIAEKGPLLCVAYKRLTKGKLKSELKSKLKIRYMTDEEVMNYIISTHNDKPISTDSI